MERLAYLTIYELGELGSREELFCALLKNCGPLVLTGGLEFRSLTFIEREGKDNVIRVDLVEFSRQECSLGIGQTGYQTCDSSVSGSVVRSSLDIFDSFLENIDSCRGVAVLSTFFAGSFSLLQPTAIRVRATIAIAKNFFICL